MDTNGPFLPFSREQRPVTSLRFTLTDHRIKVNKWADVKGSTGEGWRALLQRKKVRPGMASAPIKTHTIQMLPKAALLPPQTSHSLPPSSPPVFFIWSRQNCSMLSCLGNKLIRVGQATSYRQWQLSQSTARSNYNFLLIMPKGPHGPTYKKIKRLPRFA